MSLMSFITVFGGLAIFIFGMKMMSDGLHQVAGERMRAILRMFSANRFVAIFSGALVTCVIQSSSASTVMVIGFVNAGLISLVQAIGLIFGANIGTTITAQLVAFDISWIIMPAIILGLLCSFVPRRSIANWSATITGLGFLFFGMEIMSGELKRLAEIPEFMQAFQLFKCAPVDGVIPAGALFGAIGIGLVATCVIQSSSACSGIIIALGASGLLDIYTAVALVLGSNIGTTVTAQLAALAANRIAKQAALAHTLFNFIGVALMVGTFWISIDGEPVFFALIEKISVGSDLPRKIANAHTLFNVCTSLVLIPFIPLLAGLCERMIPVKDKKIKFERLEPHLLDTPSIALTQTSTALRQMLQKAWKMIDCALNIYGRNDEKNQKLVKQLNKREEDVDARQKAITEYLAHLMRRPLTEQEAEQIPMLLHCTNDVERIGDHAAIIRNTIEQMLADGLVFSPDAEREYCHLHRMLSNLAKCTIQLLAVPEECRQKEADDLLKTLTGQLDRSEAHHLTRLTQGECKPQVGIVYLELLEEMRKISRHLENINDRAAMFYGKFPQRSERG